MKNKERIVIGLIEIKERLQELNETGLEERLEEIINDIEVLL